jgi:hypothetical protein
MTVKVINDTADSLPATGTEATDDNMASTDATSDSSTDTGAESDSPTEGDKEREKLYQKFDELEGVTPAEDSPTTETEETDDDGALSNVVAASQDERTVTKDKATQDASQDKEISKGFASDARWQKLAKLAPRGSEKEFRAVAREFLTQEATLKAQVEKSKSAMEFTDRIKRSGIELENTAALIEGWQRGDESAEKILQDLITDLQTRRGTVLSSPELIAESKELDQQLSDGMIDESFATKRRAELLKLQKGDAVIRQTEAQKAEAAKAAQQESIGKLFKACDEAFAGWEKAGPLKNPDYTPELKMLMVSIGDGFVAEKTQQLGRYLKPAEVVECSQKAYEQVFGAIKSALPKRQAIRSVNGGSSSTNSRREPTNDRERIMARFDELERR